MKKYLILLLILTVTITSCEKYEVQYGTETAATTGLRDGVYEIAYSTEDGVFLVTAGLDRSKMLVSFANKPHRKAGRVALSPKKDKVAYVDPDNGVPVIVDTAGNVLAELTQYTNTNDLGWHNGDETLYILSNNQIHFYGPPLDLPISLFPSPSGSQDYKVTTIDINDNLDVTYGVLYHEYGGSYRTWHYGYGLNYKSPSLNDQYNTASYGSYYAFQNVATDSRGFYHTLRFSDPEDPNDVDEIEGGFAIGTATNTRFEDDYWLRKNGFMLKIGKDGDLLKRAIANNSNYEDRFWYIYTDEEPLYLDWAIGF
jgi:hypothetical protein